MGGGGCGRPIYLVSPSPPDLGLGFENKTRLHNKINQAPTGHGSSSSPPLKGGSCLLKLFNLFHAPLLFSLKLAPNLPLKLSFKLSLKHSIKRSLKQSLKQSLDSFLLSAFLSFFLTTLLSSLPSVLLIYLLTSPLKVS